MIFLLVWLKNRLLRNSLLHHRSLRDLRCDPRYCIIYRYTSVGFPTACVTQYLINNNISLHFSFH